MGSCHLPPSAQHPAQPAVQPGVLLPVPTRADQQPTAAENKAIRGDLAQIRTTLTNMVDALRVQTEAMQVVNLFNPSQLHAKHMCMYDSGLCRPSERRTFNLYFLN